MSLYPYLTHNVLDFQLGLPEQFLKGSAIISDTGSPSQLIGQLRLADLFASYSYYLEL